VTQLQHDVRDSRETSASAGQTSEHDARCFQRCSAEVSAAAISVHFVEWDTMFVLHLALCANARIATDSSQNASLHVSEPM
jgi:hypothetical protein